MAKSASTLEVAFKRLLEVFAPDLPAPKEQYKACLPRLWRWDFAYPDAKLLIEIHGGQYAKGAHNRSGGLQRDAEKNNAAVLAGWRQLIFTTGMIENDPVKCIEAVRAALANHQE